MEQRNMLLAFALSMVVLLGWQELFPQQQESVQQEQIAVEQQTATPPVDDIYAQPPVMPEVATSATQNAATPVPPRVESAGSNHIESGNVFVLGNDVIKLRVNDKGWITQGTLLKYKQSLEPGSANVDALFMDDQGHAVYANSGIIGAKQSTPFALVEQGEYSLTLQSKLDGGQVWQRQFRLTPGSYKIEITDNITNGAGLKMYRQVVERNPDKDLNTFYEHMGPTALLNGKLVEPDYDDLDEKGAERMASMGGWTAIMNRYFIAALVSNPEQNYPYYFKSDGRSYQAGLIDDGKVEGKNTVFDTQLYIGPKSIPVLEAAGSGLERSVDFGWFAPIAKPMHTFLGWLYGYLGNYGWCIIILVLCIKLLFFYPTQKSYESMAGMRKLQPEMARIKELYGDDRQRMSQEMMGLYKKHKVNPMGGCLPILIQIPVFFALYKVLLMSIEMRQAPFIGWIQDMSVQDPYFVLPVIMGASMYIQQKLNPQPPDPMQAKLMQFLPAIFTVLFLFFPAGLVLYWVVNNVLSILQQRLVMKRLNVD
ncbi:MAG: membrane protein insertase YidC [Mariprofundus sp.]